MRKDHMLKRLAIPAIAVMALMGSAGVAGASSSAPTKQDEAQAQKIVQTCVTHGNLLTKGGRNKVIACIAPAGHKAAFEACAQKAVAQGHFLTKRGRAATEQAVAVCAENNR